MPWGLPAWSKRVLLAKEDRSSSRREKMLTGRRKKIGQSAIYNFLCAFTRGQCIFFSFIILLTEKTRVHKKRENKYLKKKKQVRKHREMKKKKSGDKRHDVNIPHQMESWRRHSSPQVRNLNKNVCIQLVDGFFLKNIIFFFFNLTLYQDLLWCIIMHSAVLIVFQW